MPSKAVVIVVASFLLLALIYSSSSKFHVFGLTATCGSPGSIAGLKIYTCCYNTVDDKGVTTAHCALCTQSPPPIGETGSGGPIVCGNFTRVGVTVGGVLNPLGNAQIAPGTPPPG